MVSVGEGEQANEVLSPSAASTAMAVYRTHVEVLVKQCACVPQRLSAVLELVQQRRGDAREAKASTSQDLAVSVTGV